MFKVRPAYQSTEIPGGGGTPGAPPAPAAAPPAPVIPAPPAPGAPPAPAAPPAPVPPVTFQPAAAPWKEGEVWQIDGRPWWETIPEEPVRELMKTKQYANPAIAGTAYFGLNKLQNGAPDTLAIPGENATPEQRTEFDKRLRTLNKVPEAADKYELNVGATPDERFVKFGKDLAFELGVSPANAQKMVDKWNTFAQEMSAAQLQKEQTDNETEMTALETRWGPQFEEHRAKGEKALKALGLPEATIDKIEAKIGTAAVVELFASLGAKIGEGTSWLPGGQPVNPNDPTVMTPEAARARINALNNDQAFQTQYMTKNDPGHTAAVATMEALHRKANERPA